MLNNTIAGLKKDSKDLFNQAKDIHKGLFNKLCVYTLKKSKKAWEETIYKIADKKSLNSKDLKNLKELISLCKEADAVIERIKL